MNTTKRPVLVIGSSGMLGSTVTPTETPVGVDRTLSTTLPVFADVSPLASQIIEQRQFWQTANLTA